MSNWPRAELGTLTESDRPITYGVVKPGDPPCDGGVILIRGGDILNGRVSTDLRTISSELSTHYRRTILRGGELLVSLVGNPGAVAIAPSILAGANLARQVGMVALRSDVCAPFIMYSLMAPTGRAAIAAITKGSVQLVINLEDLKRLRVPLPPLPLQRRIASVLSAYDDLIDVNVRRIAVLEEMGRRLFHEWFVRGDAAKASVPKGWSNGKLSDIVDFRRAATKPGHHLSSRLYVPIECIGRKSLYLAEALDVGEARSSLQLFDKDDILFGAMRAYFHKVAIAPFHGVTRSTCFVLRPKKPSLLSFATFVLFHENTVAYAATHSKGATIPYASWEGALADMAVLIPPEDLLDRFNKVAEPILRTIQNMFFTQRSLGAARDLLLPKLISGEIDLERAGRIAERVVRRVAAA